MLECKYIASSSQLKTFFYFFSKTEPRNSIVSTWLESPRRAEHAGTILYVMKNLGHVERGPQSSLLRLLYRLVLNSSTKKIQKIFDPKNVFLDRRFERRRRDPQEGRGRDMRRELREAAAGRQSGGSKK